MELHSNWVCPVCLDLLREPVTIPCGHDYCKSCIEACWDRREERGKYSCPLCRKSFSPRPVLRRNSTLAELVKKLKKTRTQQASPPAAVSRASQPDVACDFCCGTAPNKATMSCLTCLASYCPAHLEPHSSVPVLKKHRLVSATVPLQQKMCTKHNKLLEVYCQTDQKCICYLCAIHRHKSHCMVSVAAGRAEEQKQLIASQRKVEVRFQEREKELTELVQDLKYLKSCSQAAVQTSDKLFDEMISSLKRERTVAKQLINAREKRAVARSKKLQLQLKEELTKLRRRHTELEQLSHTDDHIHFIQTFQSLSTSRDSPDWLPDPVVCPKRSFKTVTDSVSKLRDDIKRLVYDNRPRISASDCCPDE
ncbi:E3 ubiquitin-protein ligase TRIM47-like isoform X2 [Dicentrarchus labrax]|uniref:Tripartite motif-containing protein 25 n=1 Tax=Dicentrarchus labrax TaxID=13489 RepID=A0A8C4DYI3_DICLA|nr:E3 ubiquitin-protein ligase TRIM47-like isoform X2 [Dicentrarchus labrax]